MAISLNVLNRRTEEIQTTIYIKAAKKLYQKLLDQTSNFNHGKLTPLYRYKYNDNKLSW